MDKLTFDKLPDAVVTLTDTLPNKTGTWRNIRPFLKEKDAPCTNACPSHIKIPHYMTALSKGNIDEAIEIMLESNPFPAITGRVCPHFCQQSCNRQFYDDAIEIRAVERYIGDLSLEVKERLEFNNNRSEKIAIIGSGPAGLSAAFYLAKAGYKVDIYEKAQKAGGMLRYGIPPYRLPRWIIDREISILQDKGINFHFNTLIDKDKFNELKQNYDSVFIASGADKSKKMNIKNEEKTINGVKFLRQLNQGKRDFDFNNVAVIGGGNVAMDVARNLVRLGKNVSVIYRRTEQYMPAIREEYQKALEDGVTFYFLLQPVEFLVENDKLVGFKAVKMMLKDKDSSGRPRPVVVEGTEFIMKFDAVITAIGEDSDLSYLDNKYLTDKGYIKELSDYIVDEKIFVGGDAKRGPATVIEAIADGRRVAQLIDKFLNKKPLKLSRELKGEVVEFEKIKVRYFKHLDSQKQVELEVEDRIKTFTLEEVRGFLQSQAIYEAERCFSCGHCNECGNCYVFCPDSAISWTEEGPKYNYDYCKGCAICWNECPRGVISYAPETMFS